MKKKITLLLSTVVVAIACLVVVSALGSVKPKPKKVKKEVKRHIALAKDKGRIDINKCYLVKKQMNLVQLQTWDFEYIDVNISDEKINDFELKNGTNINIKNVKVEEKNNSKFYYVDKKSTVTINKFKDPSAKQSIVKEIIEEQQDE